jgi:hypothetical protein
MHFPAQPTHLNDLPPLSRADVQIFTYNNLAGSWITWSKPSGCTMIYMMAIDGGGGGGGGFTRTAGLAGGGGGGGGCGGIARLFASAFLIPNILYIKVGAGGLGGAASTAGGAGSMSWISYGHTFTTPSILLASGAASPGGGQPGASGSAGSGGSANTIATTATTQTLGHWSAIAGIAGGVGGAQSGAVGTSITAWATLPLSPGAGGAGCTAVDFDGGGITAAASVDINFLNFTTGPGNVALSGSNAAIATSRNGSSGVNLWQPFLMSGGAGGASSNAGVAGSGGKGGIGCGGGGGGAGTTGGSGGDGGNGLVMIISW